MLGFKACALTLYHSLVTGGRLAVALCPGGAFCPGRIKCLIICRHVLWGPVSFRACGLGAPLAWSVLPMTCAGFICVLVWQLLAVHHTVSLSRAAVNHLPGFRYLTQHSVVQQPIAFGGNHKASRNLITVLMPMPRGASLVPWGLWAALPSCVLTETR